jgi:hypothetical protein
MHRGAHFGIAAVCGTVLLLLLFVGVDQAGLRIFGWKWHFRAIDEGYKTNLIFFNTLRSMEAMTLADIKTAARVEIMGVWLFLFLCTEFAYRVYCGIIWPKKIKKKYRKWHHACFGVILAITISRIIIAFKGGS